MEAPSIDERGRRRRRVVRVVAVAVVAAVAVWVLRRPSGPPARGFIRGDPLSGGAVLATTPGGPPLSGWVVEPASISEQGNALVRRLSALLRLTIDPPRRYRGVLCGAVGVPDPRRVRPTGLLTSAEVRDVLSAEREFAFERDALPPDLAALPAFVGAWACEDFPGVLELRADGSASTVGPDRTGRRWGAEGSIVWIESFVDPGPAAPAVRVARLQEADLLIFAGGSVGRRVR